MARVTYDISLITDDLFSELAWAMSILQLPGVKKMCMKNFPDTYKECHNRAWALSTKCGGANAVKEHCLSIIHLAKLAKKCG